MPKSKTPEPSPERPKNLPEKAADQHERVQESKQKRREKQERARTTRKDVENLHAKMQEATYDKADSLATLKDTPPTDTQLLENLIKGRAAIQDESTVALASLAFESSPEGENIIPEIYRNLAA